MALAVTAYQGLKAQTALARAGQDFVGFRDALVAADADAVREAVRDAQDHAGEARANTRGPVWWSLSLLPGIGDDVTAVRTVSEGAAEIAEGVLPRIAAAADVLRPEALRPVDGRIALEPLERSTPDVVAASRRLGGVASRAAALDPEGLTALLAGPVASFRDEVAKADELAERAALAVRLLPPMLGGEGERRYLLVFQNNAEVRATGGIPGSFAVVRADDGRLSIGRQAGADDIGDFRPPPEPPTDEELAAFGPQLTAFPQSANLTPDWPRSAQILEAMWRARGFGRVDGVVSTDPVAMSYVLAAGDPVRTVGGRELSADTAVPLLLSGIYAEVPDTGAQDRVFAGVARDVFAVLTAGSGDASALLEGLSQATEERRVMVWPRRAAERALIAPTALAGRLSSGGTATQAPEVGVFLNAAEGYKLDYYLDHETSVEPVSCRGGRQEIVVSTSMSSTVPRDVSALSSYVAPRDGERFEPGVIADTVYVIGPRGGSVGAITSGREELASVASELDGRPVRRATVTLRPGEETLVESTVMTAAGQTGDPDVRTTPAVRGSGLGDVVGSAC